MAGGGAASGEANAGSNPFSMPPEMEFFWLTNTDQQKSEAEEARRKDLRVWEKPTCASRYGATKKIRDVDLPRAPMPKDVERMLALAKGKVMEEETPDATFLTTIATKPCVGVVEPLRKSEKDVRNFVQKKREVFLVQMALDVKRAEIVRLDEKARMKEEALAKSQQLLDEDTKKFEEYLQDRIAKAQQTTKDAEEKAKRKQEKQQKIKHVRASIAGIQSEIGKLRESREECARYKQFLDKLTPSEWKEHQKEIKLARKAARREKWISERFAVACEKYVEEERQLERAGASEEDDKARGKRAKRGRREEEEERLQKERERQQRRKRIQKKKEEEERRIASEYEEVSTEEEFELFFNEPKQLMDTFTELEEKNLFLIQNSQETEQMLDELQATFDHTRRDMGGKVRQLKENIRQLEDAIAQENRRSENLRRSYEEKAGTASQDRKLADLSNKVHEVYVKVGLSTDHDPDTLQMLGSIESKLEELIHGLEEAYHQDNVVVMDLEWEKEKERRERVKIKRLSEAKGKQEKRLNDSLHRSQAPVFKKAGKQIMYRSPPLRQEKKIVKDSSDDEANTRDHNVFGVYIDRKTQMPQTEPPIVEDPKRANAASRALAAAAAAEGGASGASLASGVSVTGATAGSGLGGAPAAATGLLS